MEHSVDKEKYKGTETENSEVKTESEGKEPNRYIVIVPNNLEDDTLPALPAREERRRNDRNRGGRNNYSRGGKSGNRNGGYNRGKGGYNKNRGGKTGAPTGGTTLKANNDFFGIFLGNSGNTNQDE